jgi:hypothetical protein
LVRASVILGREVEYPESIINFPSFPIRRAMFPPDPISAFTFPRRGWTVILAVSARFRAVRTMFSFSANILRGANQAAVVRIPVDVMKRRREK